MADDIDENVAGPDGGVRALVRERRRVVAAFVVVALVSAGTGWWLTRGLPDDVAVRVGETDVSVADLESRMTIYKALYGVERPTDAKKLDLYWRDAARAVVMAKVLGEAAEVEGVTVNAKQVDRSLQRVVDGIYGEGAGGRAAFETALGKAGASEAMVKDELRRQLETDALLARVTKDVSAPTRSEVEAAYADRRCRLTVTEGRQISNIVVPTRPAADVVVQRLRAGAPFGSVAAEVSIDASTRDQGGDMGVLRVDDLARTYADAAFSAERNEVFGPVRSEHGWNVGVVTAIEPARTPGLEEIRDQLRSTLLMEEQAEAWRNWLRGQLKRSDVEYNDDYRPADPLALPSEAMPGGASDKGSSPGRKC